MEHTYELRHHGVKGQTWGNRQYQNMDGSLTALGREHYGYGSARNDRKVARYEAKSKKYSTLADQSSSNFKKRYNIKKAANAEAKAEIVKQYNAKRKQGKIKSDTFGYKRSSIRNEVYSKAAKKIAEEATKEGSRSQRQWKAAAYNYKQFSNYDKKMAAKSKGKQFVESQILRTNLMGVSIQRTSGRKTTVGKEFVDRFFTGGTVGAVKDLEYKIDHWQPKDKSSSGSKPKDKSSSGSKPKEKKNIYDVNANYYNNKASKLESKAARNRTMASMNEAASESGKGVISKINSINANYYNNKASKIESKAERNRTMASMNEAASEEKKKRK